MAVAPRERFGLDQNGWTVVNLDKAYKVDASKFFSPEVLHDGHMLNETG